MAIYFIILYKYNQQDFPQSEREKIRNEVMVGRRVFWPEKTDYEAASRELVKERINRLRARGQEVDSSPSTQEAMLKEARRDVVTSDSELEFDRPKEYQFKGLPADLEKPAFSCAIVRMSAMWPPRDSA